MTGPRVNGAPEFTIGIYKMGPNQVHPPHYHPVGAEFYYIVEGTCLVRVDDEKIEVGPEAAIYLPEGTVRAVWMRPDESVTIFYGFDEQSGAEITRVGLKCGRRQSDPATAPMSMAWPRVASRSMPPTRTHLNGNLDGVGGEGRARERRLALSSCLSRVHPASLWVAVFDSMRGAVCW